MLPRDIHGVSRGCPVRLKVAAKGCPWGAKGRPGVPKRYQGMSMGCKAGPPGYQKDAKESDSINNGEARGENLRWMFPRCFPDIFPDVSQISPRFLFPDFSFMMVLYVD